MSERPISPHLQIYRPQLTSVLSILHRAAGVFLSCGVPFLVFWIWSIGQGADAYQGGRLFFASLIGRTLLLAWSFCFYYHLCNGVRHLVWDVGRGFDMETVYRGGWLVVVGSAVMTLATWVAAYALRSPLQ